MRPLLATLILVVLSACGDGRWAPGYLVTPEGETLSNNDVNVRMLAVRTIVDELDVQLAPHWRIEAAIAELPVYQGSDIEGDRGRVQPWMWPKATATLTLIGDGSVPPPLSEDDLTRAVRDYLTPRVERPKANLSVTTTRVVDAARLAARPAAPTPTASVPAAKPSSLSPQSYTLQAGDTWADLSQAFYGSTQHWRRIAEANPGEPTPGRVITIPPKP